MNKIDPIYKMPLSDYMTNRIRYYLKSAKEYREKGENLFYTEALKLLDQLWADFDAHEKAFEIIREMPESLN